jgi:hypothetical protein
MKRDSNSIANNRELTRNRKACSAEIDLIKLKDLARKNSTTVGVITFAVLSATFKEYFSTIKKSDPSLSHFEVPNSV